MVEAGRQLVRAGQHVKDMVEGRLAEEGEGRLQLAEEEEGRL